MRITKRTVTILNYQDFNGVSYAVTCERKKDKKIFSFIMRKDEFENEFLK